MNSKIEHYVRILRNFTLRLSIFDLVCKNPFQICYLNR